MRVAAGRGIRSLGGAAALPLLVSACSDASLESIPVTPPPPADNRLRVSGELCTRDPEEVRFPLRVAFAIDTSQSMAVSDPPDPMTGDTGRQRAVREAIESIGVRDDVAFAIVAFGGSPQVLTQDETGNDGFTSAKDEIRGAVAALSVDAGTTNYAGALGVLNELLTSDALALGEQDEQLRGRTRYVVVFLSDGLPDSDTPGGTGAILGAVRDLASLPDRIGVGEVVLHTAYLSANATPRIELFASDLLRTMAQAGGGTFRSFPNGEAINFLSVDFTSIRRVFGLAHLVVFNRHALPAPVEADLDGDGVPEPIPGERLPDPDSDGDGLRDKDERLCDPAIICNDDASFCAAAACADASLCDDDPAACDDPPCCLSPTLCRRADPPPSCVHPACADASLCDDDPSACDDPACCDERALCNDPACCAQDECDMTAWRDTDGDGSSDLVEFRLAQSGSPIDPCNPDDAQCPGLLRASDGDGDGLTDCDELYLGSSPQFADADLDGLPDPIEVVLATDPALDDRHGDIDLDGAGNGAEVRAHTDPRVHDAGARAQRSYRYRTEERPLDGVRSCLSFEVDNIALASTAPTAEEPDPGRNHILIYAGETPYDRPDTFSLWRVACVSARYLAEERLRVPASGRVEVAADSFRPLAGCHPDDPDETGAPLGPDACPDDHRRFDPSLDCEGQDPP